MAFIEKYFKARNQARGINWNLLINGSWQVRGYYLNWQNLGTKINNVKQGVLGDIMNAPAPSF